MQRNKAILRNNEIVIFDKKNNFAAALVGFFSNSLDWKQIFRVANSGRSLVIADNLGFLVGQKRCRFLEMTEHN